MQFRLRTLLIALAVGPVAIGLAAISAVQSPIFAALVLAWPMAFVPSCAEPEPKRTCLGLTTSEWLVIFGILLALTALALPFDQPCRE